MKNKHRKAYRNTEREHWMRSPGGRAVFKEMKRTGLRLGRPPLKIVVFKSNIDPEALERFRREWYRMISGVENAWHTPISPVHEEQHGRAGKRRQGRARGRRGRARRR